MMPETAEVPKHEVKNKSTVISDAWLQETGEHLKKLPGSAILTLFSESFLRLGSRILQLFPDAQSIGTAAWEELKKKPETLLELKKLSPDPDAFVSPILLPFTQGITAVTGLGGVLLGTFFGWQGVKHAPNVWEKMIYLGLRIGVAASYLFAPAYVPVATGIAAASTIIGMRHRK